MWRWRTIIIVAHIVVVVRAVCVCVWNMVEEIRKCRLASPLPATPGD